LLSSGVPLPTVSKTTRTQQRPRDRHNLFSRAAGG
jgi:hypothetical protein